MRAVAIIVTLITLTACSKPDPTACFTYENYGAGTASNGPSGTSHTEYFLYVKSCSTGAYSNHWNAPESEGYLNRTTSNVPCDTSLTPLTFLDTGYYEVILTVFSKNGKKSDKTSQIVHVTP